MSELDDLKKLERWPTKTEYEEGFEEWYGLGYRLREGLDRAIAIAEDYRNKVLVASKNGLEMYEQMEKERDKARAAALMLRDRLRQEHHRWLIDADNEATGGAYAPDELEERSKVHYSLPGCLHCEALADTEWIEKFR